MTVWAVNTQHLDKQHLRCGLACRILPGLRCDACTPTSVQFLNQVVVSEISNRVSPHQVEIQPEQLLAHSWPGASSTCPHLGAGQWLVSIRLPFVSSACVLREGHQGQGCVGCSPWGGPRASVWLQKCLLTAPGCRQPRGQVGLLMPVAGGPERLRCTWSPTWAGGALGSEAAGPDAHPAVLAARIFIV